MLLFSGILFFTIIDHPKEVGIQDLNELSQDVSMTNFCLKVSLWKTKMVILGVLQGAGIWVIDMLVRLGSNLLTSSPSWKVWIIFVTFGIIFSLFQVEFIF